MHLHVGENVCRHRHRHRPKQTNTKSGFMKSEPMTLNISMGASIGKSSGSPGYSPCLMRSRFRDLSTCVCLSACITRVWIRIAYLHACMHACMDTNTHRQTRTHTDGYPCTHSTRRQPQTPKPRSGAFGGIGCCSGTDTSVAAVACAYAPATVRST